MPAVKNLVPPIVVAADEGRHPSGTETLWNESWYFDVADPTTEIGAYLRLGLYPNRSQTWLHLVVAGRNRPLVVLFDEQAPALEGDRLVIQTDQWWVDMEPVVPVKQWRVQARVWAHQFDHPVVSNSETGSGASEAGADVGGSAAAVWAGSAIGDEQGQPVEVEIDLVWNSVADPYHYGRSTRYEVSAQVTGIIRIGDETIHVDAPGQRDHSWGVRDWWAFDWCWSAGTLTDGTAFHATDIRLGDASIGFGYVIPNGTSVVPADSISVTEVFDGEHSPTGAEIRIAPGDLNINVTPIASCPMTFVADDGRVGRMTRMLCRYTTVGGRSGSGWTEWNFVGDKV